MNKSVKIILISLGCIGAGLGVYFLFFKGKKGEQFPDVEDRSVEEKDTWEETTKPIYSSEGTILKLLSIGNNVKCLQSVLNVRGCKDKNGSGLTVDGKFGPLTESALSGCGEGNTISINRLKKMMQTELDKGLSIDCSDSSCCSSLVAVSQGSDDSWNPSGDDDGDGIPNSIDRDSFNPTTDDNINSIVPIGGGDSGYQYAIDPESMAFSGESDVVDSDLWFEIQNTDKGERLWDKVQNEQNGQNNNYYETNNN